MATAGSSRRATTSTSASAAGRRKARGFAPISRGLVEGYGLDGGSLENVRGYRLPLRGAGDGLTNGRGLVVGDAAGLVDPLTGDGMYEAFLSARLASRTVADFLAGRTDDLAAYAEATLRAIGPLCVASWGGKRAFDRFPRVSYSVARTRRAWRVIADLLQDGGEPDTKPDADPMPLFLNALLAATAGGAGRPYRNELRQPASVDAREVLRATAGPAAGLKLPIDGELQLGRAAPGLELLAADAELSRSHASIHRDDDGALVIEDLGSRNGTWVNGARVERPRLEPGDLIRVGESTFELVVGPPVSRLYDDELIRPWYEHAREVLAPGAALVDIHGHTGFNDPDGFTFSAEQLLATLEAAGGTGGRDADARARRLSACERPRARRGGRLGRPSHRVLPARPEAGCGRGGAALPRGRRARDQAASPRGGLRAARPRGGADLRARARAAAAAADPRRARHPDARPRRGRSRRALSRTRGSCSPTPRSATSTGSGG